MERPPAEPDHSAQFGGAFVASAWCAHWTPLTIALRLGVVAVATLATPERELLAAFLEAVCQLVFFFVSEFHK
jgi:hypothetical protein